MKPFAFLALILWSSLSWASPNAWLGPEPPGNAYPAGEAERQYEILAYDLLHRA